MGLLDGDLAQVFGAVLGAVFSSGTLHKIVHTDTGSGGFTPAATDYPVKLAPQTIGAADRAASGIPSSAIQMTVLRSGLPVPVDVDDGLLFGGAAYRVIRVETDPAAASYALTLVPA